jgi:hypothetical protein
MNVSIRETSASILETLQEAHYNLHGAVQSNSTDSFESKFVIIAKEQIYDAITLLEKGYGIHEMIDPLIDKYGSVENVPDNPRGQYE